MLSTFLKTPCFSNDITIQYLTRRLRRLDRRIERSNAKPEDYVNRDRVAIQLAEAREYLC